MPYQFPAPQEYPAYFETYLKQVNKEDDILAHLKNEQDVMVDFMKSLPKEKLDYAYEEGKWTVKEVLIHLIDTERIFCYRALCFARGEKASLPGYDHDEYAKNSLAHKRSIESIIEEYITNRAATLALFNSLSHTVLSNMGTANNKEISVRAILYIIAGHELHHTKILKERYL